MENRQPKITIITAVLNDISALEETIQNVLSLAYQPLDFIVVDGGSTDGTEGLFRRYADKLKCWISEPDQGVYDAMNKGWALADADSYILFLGAGDKLLSLPKSLDSQPDVLFGHVELDGQYFRSAVGPQLRLYNSLHHQALLVKKSCHPEPPFDLHFPLYADFDFNQRLYRLGAKFSFSSELVGYASPAGLTGKLRLDESLQVIRNNFGFFWASIAWCAYHCSRLFPVIRHFHPVKKNNS